MEPFLPISVAVFCSGCVWSLLAHHDLLTSPVPSLFLAVGFLGAYTTFSTYTYESLSLLQDGHFVLAGVKLFGSVAIGLLGVFLGMTLAKGVLGS